MADCTTFSITSGAFCFGPLLDIQTAAGAPIQSPPPESVPFLSGTVRRHDIEHNLPALDGTWRAYPLTNVAAPHQVNAWFAAHESIDARAELKKLVHLGVVEQDTNRMNNAATRQECILLVNRYDWMLPQHDDATDLPTTSAGWADLMADGNTIGIVDYSHASAQAEVWSGQTSRERSPSQQGIWMHIPDPEYMWAVVGFDDAYTQARSFLFYTIRTNFLSTLFPGEQEPIQAPETDLARYQRRLNEGKSYSGLEYLREFATPRPEQQDPHIRYLHAPPPAMESMLGPYDAKTHIFAMEDIEAILHSLRPLEPWSGTRMTPEQREAAAYLYERAEFALTFRQDILDLSNEMIMSYLESMLPVLRSVDGESVQASQLFSAQPTDRSLDGFMLAAFLGTATALPDFDRVCARARDFLQQRSALSLTLSESTVSGLVKASEKLLHEILELAEEKYAIARHERRPEGVKPILNPASIRVAIHLDEELLKKVQYSFVYWYGRDPVETW